MKWLVRVVLAALVGPLAQGDAFAKPVKVGANLSLSGKLAYIGETQLHGLQLAIEDINSSLGTDEFKLEVHAEDNGGEPKQALSAMQKLLELDKVDVVFSSLSHIVQAVKETVAKKNKVMIYGAAVDGPAREHALFFRDWGDAVGQGRAMARMMATSAKKRVVIIGEQNDAVYLLRDALVEEARNLGVGVEGQDFYAPNETDFRVLLLRLASKKPDAFGFLAWRDGALLMNQLKTLGLIGIKTFHILAPMVPANDTPEVRRLYEENGAISVWHGYVADDPKAGEAEFAMRFRAKFGVDPRTEAIFAYDDMQILAKAIKRCPVRGALDQACLARELSIMRHRGVSDELFFGPSRLASRPEVLIRVVNGKWQRL